MADRLLLLTLALAGLPATTLAQDVAPRSASLLLGTEADQLPSQ